MRQFTYSFTTTIEFSRPVTDHSFVLRCLPATQEGQEVWAQVELDPAVPASLQRDSFGNSLVIGHIAEEHTHFTYESSGTVVLGGEGSCLPNTIASLDAGSLHSWLVPGAATTQTVADEAPEPVHPLYRFPSGLSRCNDAMRAFARQAGLAAGTAPLGDAAAMEARCLDLMHAIHDGLDYEPGSTTVATTAAESFDQGRGVCQDFTHIMTAILREWGVPARYVSGLTTGCGTTHAWAQARLGDVWVGFDPTRDRETDDTYLICAVGRDWTDCPVERGTFHGNADQTQTVFMRMEEQ